jgi:hypothetical protein
MKEGMILNKWNYIEDGVVIAQCYALTKYDAIDYFAGAFAKNDVFEFTDVSNVVIAPNFNTKEK